MADGKIYITISDTRGGSGAGVSNDADKQEAKEKDNVFTSFMKHRFFNLIESQTKQFVNYTVNNIGNFTGNYQAQRDAQEGLLILGKVVGLGTSIYTGAKTGGVAGAIIAATLNIGQEAISFAYREYSEQFQNRKLNRNVDMMRRRLGLEGLTDGSRTGGY